MNEEQKWLDERRKVVTSTDVARLAGVSKWGGPMSVFAEKMGKEVDTNERMIIGRHMQKGIAGAYAQLREDADQTGVRVEHADPYQLWHHKDEPRFATSLDCWQLIRGERSILEVKGTGSYPDQPYDDWVCQVQWQMFVTGFRKATICALCGGDTMRWWDLTFDEDVVGPLTAQAHDFLINHLDIALPPAPAEGDSRAVKALYPQHTDGKEISMEQEDLDNYLHMVRLEAEGKSLVKQADAYKDKLKAKMQDAQYAYLPNGVRLAWTSYERKPYTVKGGIVRKFTATEPKG
jgi:predicted phage-related endonuclease